MKRLPGPVVLPVAFVLTAALVFAGLGWLTVVALRVERAQRAAAAEAELGNKLRVALWQLDGSVLLQLGAEDNRPFHHYSSADPLAGSTAGPTPLLAAQFPGWMKLHVQLDPAVGWESPQVLTPEARDRIRFAWPDLPLQNDTPDRAAALADLRAKYPADATGGLLAARDRVIPEDAPPFAAPLFTTESWQQSADPAVAAAPASAPKPPPPPGMEPVSALPTGADPFRLFGWELRRRELLAADPGDGATKMTPRLEQQQKGRVAVPQSPPTPVAQAPGSPRGGFGKVPDNDRGREDFWNRAQTIQRGSQEAKGASNDPMYGKNYPSSLPGNDLRNNSVPGPAAPGGGPGGPPAGDAKDGKGGAAPPGKPSPAEPDRLKDANEQAKANESELLKKQQTEKAADGVAGRAAFLQAALERQKCLDELGAQARRLTGRNPVFGAGWAVAGAVACPPIPATAPGEERPAIGNQLTNTAGNGTLVPFPVVNIHLGSMRPQWLTAADGTELLVLVRVAKLDGRAIYQGVVLDWPKLRQLLLDEVKEAFPGAALVPVKNPDDAVPARAMTALPVQLDPGPQPEPPPAGWTPLRLGLALAWAAAFVACAAVGLSGWSLLDLAERRIRFVSAVTHELRTPLTSLRLYLDLLTSGLIQDEAKRQEYLNTLAVESDRLHRLVENVLDFAKLERRRGAGARKPVPASELLDQLRDTWADRVAADGMELVLVSTLPPGLEVCTDAAMVGQIVGNLIDNARKYARDAADRRIWLWARPDGPRRVVFEVEDRGPGVPAGERKAVFQPFRRGSGSDTTGGAGLGLALAKQWAEVLGGTVAYRPADGAPGACFRLELPS